MSVTVDDAAPQWNYFLASNSSCSSSREAIGWNQLADNATANTLGLWNGTETWTSTPGASMMLAFQGTELILYSTVSPDGGYMSVTIDNITTPVSLNSSEVLYGTWVFSVAGLDPNWMHAVTITMLNGTNVNVDKVGIQPPAPNAFPPAWPQVQLAALPNQTGIQIPSCAAVTPTSTITPVAKTTTTEMTTSTVIETDRTIFTKKNNSGEMAGVIVGTGFAVAIVVILGFFVWRFFNRDKSMSARRGSNRRSEPGHLKQLFSGTMLSGRSSGGQRHSRLRSSDSAGSFGNVRSEALMEDDEEKRNDIETGSTEMEKLPSIRHPSTIAIDMSSMFSRTTTPVSLLPPPPAPVRGPSPLSRLNNGKQLADEPRKGWHPRSRGFPFSLSIDTNMKSARSSVRTKTKSSGWLTDDEILHRTSKAMSDVGPSRLGGDRSNVQTESSQEDGLRPSRALSMSGGSERDGTETAEFYAAYARAGFLQNEPEEYEDIDDDEETSLNQGKGRDTEDYEDDSIDTPLIPSSPAIPSSNASIAHGSPGFYSFSSGKRGSKASKVLRSFRSRSSMRHSVGRRSTQSSADVPKSPEASAKTPRTPLSSRASVSTRNRKSSVPSVPGHGISPSPEVPAVPELASGSSGTVIEAGLSTGSGSVLVEPLAPPSAWSESKKRLLMRPYKPAFGPRARSESASSLSSVGSSGIAHDQSEELFPTMRDASILSVVDENSAPDREQSFHDQDI